MTGQALKPPPKGVVLIGAGHAHIQLLERFGAKPLAGVRLTLITSNAFAPYSGMLPGLIAGLYSFEDAHIDMRPLCQYANARLILSTATSIDLRNKSVHCESHPPVTYDLVSINTGSAPNTALVPGAALHAIPVKPIDQFLKHFEGLRARVLAAGGDQDIALVGGGAGGVELMLSIEGRLRRDLREQGHDAGKLRLTLITASQRILPGHSRRFGERFEAILEQRGVAVVTGERVVEVDKGAVLLERSGRITADESVWVTEAGAPLWLRSSGLPLSRSGFLAVDKCLRVLGERDVFGAGDAIDFAPHPLPKSGVYAVRAGPVLADNIVRRLAGRPLQPFKPQRRAMYLVSTGERYAIGARGGFVFGGRWVWRLKDWIDRRFMARFKTPQQ